MLSGVRGKIHASTGSAMELSSSSSPCLHPLPPSRCWAQPGYQTAENPPGATLTAFCSVPKEPGQESCPVRSAPSRRPHGELSCASGPGGCERDPGNRGGQYRQQPGLGCPRGERGAHPWRVPSAGRRTGRAGRRRLRPGWAATRCAGTARRVGTPSAWGSRCPDVGAWQGPHRPEASLCAGPTSGAWHSGRAGGSEAETKQPSPWQCPPARDKCPRLSGEDGHKELLASRRGSARATPCQGQATCHSQAGGTRGKRGDSYVGTEPLTPLLIPKSPLHGPGATVGLMLCSLSPGTGGTSCPLLSPCLPTAS